MRCCRKFLTLVVVAAIGATSLAAKKAEKPREPAKEGAKKKESGKKANPDKGDDEGKMSVPIPKGHDSKGLRIPYFGADGKLQMTFTIGVASRLDEDHVKMHDLQVETLDEKGAREMLIEIPSSVLVLTTRVITTKEAVTIKSSDFELTGNAMDFNTKTKQGRLVGAVRMVIYNLNEEATPATEGGQPGE
jgi:hypothetical protein